MTAKAISSRWFPTRKKINPVPRWCVLSDPKSLMAPQNGFYVMIHNLVFEREKMVFEGTAGLLHHSADKKYFEAALFQGTKIGIPGIMTQFTALPQYGGMSLKNTADGFSGIIQVRKETTMQFSVSQEVKGLTFYLDGKVFALKIHGRKLLFAHCASPENITGNGPAPA